MSRLSMSFCSHSASFGSAIRLLDRLSVGGVNVSVCPYTGSADLSFSLRPKIAPFFEAIGRLAFKECPGYDYDFEFVAEIKMGGDNARYFALEALLEAVGS